MIINQKLSRISQLFYEVSYYDLNGVLRTKSFERFYKAKKYVNFIHSLSITDQIEITKTFVYYAHEPRHKTWYVSYAPNQLIKIESY